MTAAVLDLDEARARRRPTRSPGSCSRCSGSEVRPLPREGRVWATCCVTCGHVEALPSVLRRTVAAAAPLEVRRG